MGWKKTESFPAFYLESNVVVVSLCCVFSSLKCVDYAVILLLSTHTQSERQPPPSTRATHSAPTFFLNLLVHSTLNSPSLLTPNNILILFATIFFPRTVANNQRSLKWTLRGTIHSGEIFTTASSENFSQKCCIFSSLVLCKWVISILLWLCLFSTENRQRKLTTRFFRKFLRARWGNMETFESRNAKKVYEYEAGQAVDFVLRSAPAISPLTIFFKLMLMLIQHWLAMIRLSRVRQFVAFSRYFS